MKREKKSLTVLIPGELHEKLKELAAENCYSLSGYVRQILKEHLRHLEAAPDGRPLGRPQRLP